MSLFNLFNKDTVKTISISLHIDELEGNNNEIYDFNIDMNKTLKNLRKMVNQKFKKFVSEDLFWWINYKFFDDNTTFEKLKDVMIKKNGNYIINGIIIPPEKLESIDYNLELYLCEKYSLNKDEPNTKEPIFDMDYVQVATPNIQCDHCTVLDFDCNMINLNFCNHRICRNCIFKAKENALCPIELCGKQLLDYELQKMLKPEEYDIYQQSDLPIKPIIGWKCEICTFVNKPYNLFCDACMNQRPNNYKIPNYWSPSEEDLKIIESNPTDYSLECKTDVSSNEKYSVDNLKKMSQEPLWFSPVESDCPICGCSYPAFETVMLRGCFHTICKDCLHEYVVNSETAKIQCPNESCEAILEDQEIRKILKSSEYENYIELSMRIAQATDRLSYQCRTINCKGWIIRDSDNIKEFKCEICHKTNCIICRDVHENVSCEEYQIMKKCDPASLSNEVYIQALINNGLAMKCPGCNILVEKNKGCDGVLCKVCNTMMCWATKGPRWGPKGKGDRSGGCGCRYLLGMKCHPSCKYCH